MFVVLWLVALWYKLSPCVPFLYICNDAQKLMVTIIGLCDLLEVWTLESGLVAAL